MKLTFLFKKIFIKMLPIKKDRIIFTSFNGHYSDSPKYLCQEIYKLKPDAELIWLVDEKYKNDVPDYAKSIIYDSFKGLYYYASANIIIDNVYGFEKYHGTDFKTLRKLAKQIAKEKQYDYFK